MHADRLGSVDTITEENGTVFEQNGYDPFGKPRDAAEALVMLGRLQGRTHEVWTGVAVVRDREQRTAAEVTRVQFARLTEAEMAAYVRTGEPLGKAGGYAIQGQAAQFVRRIEGDYANVVGLPLHRLRAVLADLVPEYAWRLTDARYEYDAAFATAGKARQAQAIATVLAGYGER